MSATLTHHAYTAHVHTATVAQADQVIAQRLGHDEEYGFAYTLSWQPAATPGRYAISVDGCSSSQADQVIAERLDHDEDDGLAYQITHTPA